MMKNFWMNRAMQELILVLGLVLFSWNSAYAQVGQEPGVRINLGEEGKSIQDEAPAKEEYTYIPGERRDPFASLLTGGIEISQEGDELTP